MRRQIARRAADRRARARAFAAHGSAALALATCLAGAPAGAGEEPKTGASGGGGTVLPIRDGTLELSLTDAVNLAIERNLDVEILRYGPLTAQDDLKAAWGAYDPQLFGEGGVIDAQEQNANLLQGADQSLAEDQISLFKNRIWDGRAGFRGLVPWVGASYQAFYEANETETSLPFEVFSPEYTGRYEISARIPLLRGLFWDETWTTVRLARIGSEASNERFRTELMDVVLNTERAYWGLIAAQESRAVAEKSLEIANALLEQTQAQFEVGVVSKVEVVQAEAGVADREFNLIRAQAVESNQQDALIDIVLGPYLEPETELRVQATDRPEDITVRDVSTVAATEHAMARRPELQLARKDIERRKVDEAFTSNQRLPQLDVVGSFGQNSIAGDVNSDLSPILGAGGAASGASQAAGSRWYDANDDLLTTDAGRTYTVRGLLSIPLGNNTARALNDKAKLELRRSETALRRLEQSIVSEIRRAARNLEAAVQGIEAAERAEVAAAEQLRAERVRLEHGESTPFDVLLREDDLRRAQGQKIFAEQTYHDSVAELDRAQGTILDRHQIVVDQAATLR